MSIFWGFIRGAMTMGRAALILGRMETQGRRTALAWLNFLTQPEVSKALSIPRELIDLKIEILLIQNHQFNELIKTNGISKDDWLAMARSASMNFENDRLKSEITAIREQIAILERKVAQQSNLYAL
ncbi:hypothetical protein EBR21_15475, partial [bacterium]|nr:hypothetical protein [bacterium]